MIVAEIAVKTLEREIKALGAMYKGESNEVCRDDFILGAISALDWMAGKGSGPAEFAGALGGAS